MSVDFIELRSEDTLLARTREAPGHPAPEDVLLGFDPLAWENRARCLEGATGCQREPHPRRCQTQDAVGSRLGRARLPRGLPTVDETACSFPALARERGRGPNSIRFSACREFCSKLLANRAAVSLSAWLTRPVNSAVIRFWAASSASAVEFGPAGTENSELAPRSRRAVAVLFVRAEVEFERPRLPDAGIRADARDLEQAQFVHLGLQSDGKRTRRLGGRLVR